MLSIKTFTVNPLQENCYILSDETKECVIIDCGAFTENECKEIIDYIHSEQLKPVHLIATHGHFDHNLGIGAMEQAFGLKLKIHRADEHHIRNISQQAQDFMGMVVNFTPQIDTFLNGGDTINFGTHHLQCIAAPGHSMGGLLFYCEEEKVLFSGDTLFRCSIGRTDLPGGSMFMIINSLRQLCQLPDSVTVYPGHGPYTTISYELAHNPYLDR